MPSAIDRLTQVQDQLLETANTIQQPVIDFVRRAAESAESFVPDFPQFDALPSNGLPKLEDLVLNQFAFAGKVLSNQKDFAQSLLDAMKPVLEKLDVTEPAPKPAPAKSTKAPAAA